MKIEIFLIDDHLLFSQGLASLLQQTDEFVVVGISNSGAEALEQVKKLRQKIRIFLVDYYLPDMYGTELVKPLRLLRPGAHVVMLTLESSPVLLSKLLSSGGTAMMTKSVEPQVFFAALRRIATKAPVAPNDHPEEDIKLAALPVDPRLDISNFTKREFEIIQLIAQGRTSREIADLLYISLKTTENHRNNILRKSGAKNMVQLINFMINRQKL